VSSAGYGGGGTELKALVAALTVVDKLLKAQIKEIKVTNEKLQSVAFGHSLGSVGEGYGGKL
jgi:hypothetical protein